MGRKNIDLDNLTVTGAHATVDDTHVEVREDVIVIVTRAFGPKGDSLIGVSDVTFDGYPAVTLLVKAGDREGLVHLSPFHGDRRKAGMTDIPIGTRCELFCPVSKEPLDHIGRVGENSDADYYAIYLTEKLSEDDMVAVSNVWGDYHSRIVDHFELISWWADSELGDEDE